MPPILRGRGALALAALLTLHGCHASDPPGVADQLTTRRDGPATGTPPNVVFLLADDQRFDALGAAGHPIVETPHLDRLARDGTRFSNAFCTTSICPVSRTSFLTGQFASRHGILDFGTGLSDSQFTDSWIGILQSTGYTTAFVGKWGLGGELPRTRFDLFQGFAGQGRYFLTQKQRRVPVDREGPPPYFDPSQGSEHLTAHHGSVAADIITSPELREPFALQVSFKAPHAQGRDATPFQHDTRFAGLYEHDELPAQRSATPTAFASQPMRIQVSEGRIRWRERFSTEERRIESIRSYYRLITGLDEAVGRVLSALEERGVADRTVVVFSSDNGFLLGEHGLAGKWFPLEESIRIPMIIFDPRLPETRRSTVVEDMVLNVDLAPTLIELAGARAPKEMQGRSLAPLLRGPVTDWRTDWYYEHRVDHPTIPGSEAIRTMRWKLVRYLDEPIVEQLFDLENDPGELVDLSGDIGYEDQIAVLRSRLDELRSSAR